MDVSTNTNGNGNALDYLVGHKTHGNVEVKLLESENGIFRLRKRVSFSRSEVTPVYPDLLSVQLDSFDEFMQEHVPHSRRRDIGLQAAFKTNFPIEDASSMFQLEFIEYSIEKPKYGEEECRERELTYAKPLKAKLRLSSKADKKFRGLLRSN